MTVLPKPVESLWTLITAPLIWAAHFLLCYVTAAVYCAKRVELAFGFDALRAGIGLLTLAALAGIALAGILAWRQWGFGSGEPPHDSATVEDRRSFQGFATLLLAGLSFVAVIYAALPILFLTDCRP